MRSASAIQNELNSRDAKRLIAQLARFPKPPLLVLTRGDPLKRPDFEILDHAVRAGLAAAMTQSATPLVPPRLFAC